MHGGLNLSELRALGLRPDEVLDFSASINPLGASPLVREALQRVDLVAYPDPDCRDLREALSQQLGLELDGILIGNGATELIHLVARSVLRQGDAAAILAPTFGEFEAACRLQGVAPVQIAPADHRTFRWDLQAAARRIAALRPAVLFVCNPNNPTGTYLGEADVTSLAAALGERGLLALDEAYAPFVDGRWDAKRLLRLGNVALLRSMTKDHALTGLRLGYLLASPAVAERVGRFQHSWSVNAAAQAAGIAALADPGHVERGRAAAGAGRSIFNARSAAWGWHARKPPRTSCSCAWAMPRRSARGCCGSTASACETAPRSGCRSTCASASGAWRTAGGWPARYGR